MNPEYPHKLKLQSLLSKITLLLVLVLLIFMIIVEDEPGAIPLFLILAGTTWYFWVRRKMHTLLKKI